jgi:hypothetical protein
MSQIVDREPYILSNLIGIVVTPCVCFEVVKVKDLIGEVGFYEYVNIEVDVAQYFTIKGWKHIDVAIKTLQRSLWSAKPKDVVPAVQPVILSAQSSGCNCPQQGVLDVLVEFSIEHQQWCFILENSSYPTAMLSPIIFMRPDKNSRCWVDGYFLPLFAQSARNCACPFSVSG